MKKKIDWKILILALIIVYLIAFLGSLFTSGSVSSEWYNSIKPEITPPSFVFPIVWNILYFLIAISFYVAWHNGKKNERTELTVIYGINLLLNLTWSLFFFGLKLPTVAFFEMILLFISIFVMISVSHKISRLSAYLLIPYLLWVSFAVVLNYLSVF